MQQINLDFFQLILLIGFIYVFTYYWLPQQKCNDTDEYLKLLEKYNKVLNDRKMYKREYLKVTNIHNKNPDISIGKSISAHSGALKPRSIHQSDNAAVNQMVN
jgi:hypothetical protein